MKKILITLVKIGVSVAILGYLVWDAITRGESAFTDAEGNFVPETLLGVIRHAGSHAGWLVAACIACASAVLLTMIRWYYLVRALDLQIRLKDALRIGFLGYLFNLAPMGIVGGDLLKAWLLARRHPGHRPEAVVTVLVDRLIGLYFLFIVASVAILVTGFWRSPAPFVQWTCKITLLLTLIGTVGVIIVLIPDLSRGGTTRWLGRVPKVGLPLLRLIEAVQMYRHKLPVLAAAALMSIAVHSLFTVGIFLIATGFYDGVPALGVHFVLSPVSAATGVLPIAMGPFEYMLDRLYMYAPAFGGGAMALGQGLVVAFGYRIITIMIAVIGFGYYLGSREEVAEALHEAEEEALEEQQDRPAATETATGAQPFYQGSS